MNTSERLSAWIVDLKLYEEFWASVPAECRKNGEIASRAEYEELALEFLKEHFAKLCGIIGTTIPPEPQTYTTTTYATTKSPEPYPKPESMNELATRLRKQAQAYAQDARERQTYVSDEVYRDLMGMPPKKPTDPWGEATDTRGYPDA